tara:strand:- start:415 stop:693 length:279 start_codon:yes stop_codon:yes gene_type:complete
MTGLYKYSMYPTRSELAYLGPDEIITPMPVRNVDEIAWELTAPTEEELETLPRMGRNKFAKMKASDVAASLPAVILWANRPMYTARLYELSS